MSLGPPLDNSPSSDSERTYLWSPSKDLPCSFMPLAPLTDACLSTITAVRKIHNYTKSLPGPASASTDPTSVSSKTLHTFLYLHFELSSSPFINPSVSPQKSSLKLPDQTVFTTLHYCGL
ncbi:hypothetical protein ILYODFUR_016919 [Ilyodon furcidens]|uniref:Uncharacterized protein n=1 Tax=Ilyodon furcidens TaxID=33524 RepID=A0ABV0U5Z2_9TELE